MQTYNIKPELKQVMLKEFKKLQRNIYSSFDYRINAYGGSCLHMDYYGHSMRCFMEMDCG